MSFGISHHIALGAEIIFKKTCINAEFPTKFCQALSTVFHEVLEESINIGFKIALLISVKTAQENIHLYEQENCNGHLHVHEHHHGHSHSHTWKSFFKTVAITATSMVFFGSESINLYSNLVKSMNSNDQSLSNLGNGLVNNFQDNLHANYLLGKSIVTLDFGSYEPHLHCKHGHSHFDIEENDGFCPISEAIQLTNSTCNEYEAPDKFKENTIEFIAGLASFTYDFALSMGIYYIVEM